MRGEPGDNFGLALAAVSVLDVNIEPALRSTSSTAFQREVLELLPEFWPGRDVRSLHHSAWFRQFADAAMTARTEDGALRGYLLACVTRRLGYVHLIATHPRARRQGVARSMYDAFFTLADDEGCTVTEAVTTPPNRASTAFHERLGFTATLVSDYAGPGEDRVHFVRRVPGHADA